LLVVVEVEVDLLEMDLVEEVLVEYLISQI
jgi:hypothetical protein